MDTHFVLRLGFNTPHRFARVCSVATRFGDRSSINGHAVNAWTESTSAPINAAERPRKAY